MKLHLFAAAAAALLCAAPIVSSADADVLELNNLDFEEQKDSLLLDNFISESEGSEIRVRMGKAEGPSPSRRRTRRPTGGKATSRPTRRPTPARRRSDNFISESEGFSGKSRKDSEFCRDCRDEARQASRNGRRSGKASVSRNFRSRAVQQECRQECGIDLRRAVRRAESRARRNDRRDDRRDDGKSGKSDVEEFSEDTEFAGETKATKAPRKTRSGSMPKGKSGKGTTESEDTEFAGETKATKAPRSVRTGKAEMSDGSLPVRSGKSGKGSKRAAVPAVFAYE